MVSSGHSIYVNHTYLPSVPFHLGIGATSEIRSIEARMMKEASTDVPRSHILALTGMSSLEDKRRAFEAGVDG